MEPSTAVALFPTHIGGAVQELTPASYMVARDGRFLMHALIEDERTEPIRFISNRERD